jgi:hypothetical protein
LAGETLTAVKMLARLRVLEAPAEEVYGCMYDALAGGELTTRYSDAKESLYEAIALARRLGLGI